MGRVIVGLLVVAALAAGCSQGPAAATEQVCWPLYGGYYGTEAGLYDAQRDPNARYQWPEPQASLGVLDEPGWLGDARLVEVDRVWTTAANVTFLVRLDPTGWLSGDFPFGMGDYERTQILTDTAVKLYRGWDNPFGSIPAFIDHAYTYRAVDAGPWVGLQMGTRGIGNAVSTLGATNVTLASATTFEQFPHAFLTGNGWSFDVLRPRAGDVASRWSVVAPGTGLWRGEPASPHPEQLRGAFVDWVVASGLDWAVHPAGWQPLIVDQACAPSPTF